MVDVEKIQLLYDWLKTSKHTVVLTGAGMSTESGVPDFRSATGWWTKTDPQKVATIEALEHDYPLFHEFYSLRINALQKIEPHEGHKILADWQEQGIITRVATQNVDGLHQKAGSEHVDELHGSIRIVRCHSCNSPATIEAFQRMENCECGGKLRPNVVLFGEMLPEIPWINAMHNIQKADLVIVIGTSLEVYPVNQLPTETRGKTVYINLDISNNAKGFDLILQGKAKEVLMEVNDRFKSSP